MIPYSHGCIFISKSAYDSNQRTQTEAAEMRVLKEDMMEVMICRKLHAAIRYK